MEYTFKEKLYNLKHTHHVENGKVRTHDRNSIKSNPLVPKPLGKPDNLSVLLCAIGRIVLYLVCHCKFKIYSVMFNVLSNILKRKVCCHTQVKPPIDRTNTNRKQ